MVLVLELTSTRLFAYIGSSHATSTALSIALLGSGVGAFIRVRWPGGVRFAAPGLAASLLGVAGLAMLGVGLTGLVVASLVPFACAGALVSDAYAERGSSSARATYAIDLFAAAAGCLIAPRVIGPLDPTEIMLVLGLGCCALAAIRGSRWIAMVAVAQLALLIAGGPDGPLDAMLSDARSEKAITDTVTSSDDVVDSVWSPLGRLDVHRRSIDEGARLGVYTDGMSPTYLVEKSRAKAGAFETTWGLLMALPYRALRPERVLVLGAGAGASVWVAKKYGAKHVDAVEVNPAIQTVLARWKQFGGDVYHQPGVKLVIDDARRFLTDTEQRYDLIELALALTGNAHAQQPSGLEANLYTVEAVRLYLSRLTPTGSLVLIHSDPGNAYRQLLTVLEALGGDRQRALDGIVVLHDPRPGTAYRFMLVVRTSPIPIEVADRLDVAELLWAPGDPPERATELLDPAKLGITDADDLAPVHDDRPYFFQNTNGLVATALAEPGRLYVLAGALVLVVVLLVERKIVRPALVASGLGAAFLTVELALIQHFTLAAGGTLYAVSFTLFCLLAWSAAGALLLGARWRSVSWAAAAAAGAVLATAIVTRDLSWLDAMGDARLLVVALLLAPVGLTIGGPFPTLLARHGDHIASLWAINGAASVAGGIVAVLALRVLGATETLLLAAAYYGAVAVISPR